jgi:Uma2 family endonuclease
MKRGLTSNGVSPGARGAARWPAQGEWTWEDYLRLPDDGNRYEIIEGVLYVTAAPIYDHQFFVLELAGALHPNN